LERKHPFMPNNTSFLMGLHKIISKAIIVRPLWTLHIGPSYPKKEKRKKKKTIIYKFVFVGHYLPFFFFPINPSLLHPLSSVPHPSSKTSLSLSPEMASATTPVFKSLSMADSSCLLTMPPLFATSTKNPYPILSIPSIPFKLHLSCSHSSLFSPPLSLRNKTHSSSIATFAAQTSGWAQQEEDINTITIDQQEQEAEPIWGNEGVDGTEARVSDWEADGEDSFKEGVEAEGESGEDGVFKEGEEEEEQFVEPPEEAKLFVGNLPYDVDSQKLALLFEQAGTVEIAEVMVYGF
jgi:hypothetical protein